MDTISQMRKIRWLLPLALVVVVGIACSGYLLNRLSKSRYGVASDANALPDFGQAVASLHPKGPLYYRYIKAGVAGHLVVSGVTDRASVEAFAARNEMSVMDDYPPDASLRKKLQEYRGRQMKIETDFPSGTCVVVGTNAAIGDVELFLRPSDGVFTMSAARDRAP
ncbi:MAG TPA: hypothetical protein VH475_14605 [Tepidisphaeraceae bacterium]